MTAISGREEFKDYYKNLLKHSMPQDSMRLAQIQETFRALAALKFEQNLNVPFGNQTIKAEDLGDREVKIFKRYVHKYADKNPIAEEKVFEMLEDLNNCGFEKIKNQFLLNEIPKNIDSESISATANNTLSRILVKEQDLIKDKKKAIKISTTLSSIGVAVGVTTFGAGIGLLLTLGMATPLPVALMLAGGMGALLGIMLLTTNENLTGFNKLERIERYRQIIKEEGFTAFAEENQFNKIKDDDEKVLQFFKLYKIEKKLSGKITLKSEVSEKSLVSLSSEEVSDLREQRDRLKAQLQ